MVQASLFEHAPTEHGRARHADPPTAKAAAKSVDVADLERRVIEALRRFRWAGMTTHELAIYLNVDLVSVSPRMRPLVNKGFVIDSGERRVGESGRSSIVWKTK